MNEIDRKLMMVAMAFDQLINNLSMHFPMMKEEITNISQTLNYSISQFDNQQGEDAINGLGPNSILLRRLHQYFPEKGLDKVVVDGLPNIYEWKDGELEEFLGNIRNSLNELKHFDISSNNPVIDVSELRWFSSYRRKKSEDTFFNHPLFHKNQVHFPPIYSEELKTGFYRIRDNRYGYSGEEWMLVFEDGDNVYIIREHSFSITCYIKVPLEDRIVETNDIDYANPERLKEMFKDILYQIGYVAGPFITKETICDDIRSTLSTYNVPALTRKEFDDTFKPERTNTYSENLVYPETPFNFVWHKEEVEDEDKVEIGKKNPFVVSYEYFKFRSYKTLLSIQYRGEEGIVQEIRLSGVGEFNTLPYRVRVQIRDWIIKEIKATSEYFQNLKTD